jgi:hypothetical protein
VYEGIYDTALELCSERDEFGSKLPVDWTHHVLAAVSIATAIGGIIGGAILGWQSGGYIGVPIVACIGGIAGFLILGRVIGAAVVIPLYLVVFVAHIARAVIAHPADTLRIAAVIGVVWLIISLWGIGVR